MEPSPSYFILTAANDLDGCVVDQYPRDMQCIWQPTEGVRVRPLYPSALDFHMSRRMGGKRVSDVLRNTLGYFIVSERMRHLLEAGSTADIEFLPLQLFNHKGRRELQTFFIANVLAVFDCMDPRRSEYEPSALKKGELFELRRLHLDTSRIDPRRNIFRLASMPRVIIIREELAHVLQEAGLTGMDLIPMGSAVTL